MTGVYGNFLTAFPELMQPVMVWTKKDGSDKRTIRAILLDDTADGIRRKKYTSGNTALDIYDDAILYIDAIYIGYVNVGDYFYHPNNGYMMRICHQREYNQAAGYEAWDVEKVGGTTPEQTNKLNVKEGYIV